MTTLRIYAPDVDADSDEATPIPFPAQHARDSAIRVLQRSQRIAQNRKCPNCDSRSINTIELNDGLKDWCHYTVPGTASLVGFHCDVCATEWPAERD